MNGEVKLTYEQYKELYGQVIAAAPKPGIAFDADYDSRFYSFSPGHVTMIPDLPALPELIYSSGGQSFAAVYYSDEVLYFSPVFLNFYGRLNVNSTDDSYGLALYYIKSKTLDLTYFNGTSFMPSSGTALPDVASSWLFSLDSVSGALGTKYSFPFYECSVDYILKFDGSAVSSVPLSEFDPTGLESGMITTVGNYSNFLKSVKGFNVTKTPVLDDLTNTIPTEYNYLADGGDLETLRLILGHSSINTTQIYLHLAFNLKLSRSRYHSHLDFLEENG